MKLGIAGIGHVGKLHLFNSCKLKDVEVVGIADKSKKNRTLAKRLGVKKCYSDYSELFEKNELDAVIISLPNFLKTESVILASENNIDIMLEKPLARSFEEARVIKSTVENHGNRLMVSTNYRYFPHVKKLKHIIAEGSIGKVPMATIENVMNGPWSHPLYPAPTPDWWFNKELVGGGVLLDVGYHNLDLFTWLFGKCDVEVANLGFHYNLDMEDNATLLVKSKSGTRGIINCGWFSNVIFPRFNFRIIAHGTNGYLNTDDLKPSSIYLNGAKEGIKNFFRRITGQQLKLLSYTYYYSSYAEILNEFISSVHNGKDFPIELDQQLGVQEAIQKSYDLFYETKRIGESE